MKQGKKQWDREDQGYEKKSKLKGLINLKKQHVAMNSSQTKQMHNQKKGKGKKKI